MNRSQLYLLLGSDQQNDNAKGLEYLQINFAVLKGTLVEREYSCIYFHALVDERLRGQFIDGANCLKDVRVVLVRVPSVKSYDLGTNHHPVDLTEGHLNGW